MNTRYLDENITIDLMHADYIKFEERSKYPNVISPFSRLYYIEEGGGELIQGEKRITLERGYIYLIPSFEKYTFIFDKGLSHYVIHCTLAFDGGVSPFDLFKVENKLVATPLDKILFVRLVKIIPDIKLPHRDPNVYQKKLWVNPDVNYSGFGHHLEITGIIKLIFSRFISDEKNKNPAVRFNMQQIFFYIKSNLYKDISVKELAGMACLSPNHFSKRFKSIVGIGPCEFILRQRLETAQLLLLTTNMSLQQIINETNFKSLSYFSRVFKQKYSMSPTLYRKYKSTF